MGDKVFFINTGDENDFTGWLIGVNLISYAITNVFYLDGGLNHLAFYKCSVLSFNGKLYFHL